DGGIRFLLLQDEINGSLQRLKIGRAQRASIVSRREPRGEQQRVPLAQRHVEHAGEEADHRATRLSTAGLEEAEMARRDAGFDGQRELTEAADNSPVTQQTAKRRVRLRGSVHTGVRIVTQACTSTRLPLR